MNRQQANLKIIDALRDYINENPDQRFGQILKNIGIVKTENATHWNSKLSAREVIGRPYYTNIFYEESDKTLEKIIERLNEHKSRTKKQD